MSRNIFSYIIRMFYFLCKAVVIIEIDNFIYVSDIDIITRRRRGTGGGTRRRPRWTSGGASLEENMC